MVMSNMLKYVIMFLMASYIGWLYEFVFFGRRLPDGVTHRIFGVSLPILPVYGIAYLIIDQINWFAGPWYIKALIGTVIINLFECVVGLLSKQFYGYHTWKYDGCVMCDGYVSLTSGLWWTILITMYYFATND